MAKLVYAIFIFSLVAAAGFAGEFIGEKPTDVTNIFISSADALDASGSSTQLLIKFEPVGSHALSNVKLKGSWDNVVRDLTVDQYGQYTTGRLDIQAGTYDVTVYFTKDGKSYEWRDSWKYDPTAGRLKGENGAACKESSECESNYCSAEGKCEDVAGIIQRIINFLRRFGFEF